MSAYIYIEGGAKGAGSKIEKLRCQEAFHKLLDKMGFKGKKPRLVACGGRSEVYNRFKIEHMGGKAEYVAMWLDSEEPVVSNDATWDHLKNVQSVPAWEKPQNAEDEQVLFMTTCMETWIAADRETLKEHYGAEFQESALPGVNNLEMRPRQEIQEQLFHSTRNCKNAYKKGERSYQIFGQLIPNTLMRSLPSFARVSRILHSKL